MNKISFIIEFDEVSKTQEEQLTEFIEKTGIKFQVLESDNDLKKYKKYKEVIDKLIEYLQEKYDSSSLCGIVLNFTEFEDIKDLLKEVE